MRSLAGLLMTVFGAAVAGTAVVAAAAVGFGAAPAEAQVTPEQELADRHAPIILVRSQAAECDPEGEQYLPMSAEAVLDNPQILLRQVGDGNPVISQGPSAADLFDLGEGFYLDFPGDAFDPGCIYERDAERYADGRPPTVYAHVATQPDRPDRLALQYWFFYYYNDYNNLHEGDWEGIQLLFEVGSVAEALATDPVSVGYSQHFGGEIADWDGPKLQRDGARPIVYPAVGSHASYFSSTLFLGRSGSQGFGCDNTEGPSDRVDPAVVVLPTTVDGPDDPFAWLAFEGRWGERQSEPFNGPTGPAQKDRWTAPIDWHDDLRSSSVAIPGGTDSGTPIVGTFCTIVEWGSARYIGLQRNPLILVAGLVVVGAVALLASWFTDWDPVRVVPLVRRRKIGQIVRGAGRLYRTQPRRIFEIGLTYLPVSAVIGATILIVEELLLLGVPDDTGSELGPIGLLVYGLVNAIAQTAAALVIVSAVAVFLAAVDDGDDEFRGWDGYRSVWVKRRALLAGFGRALGPILLLLASVVGIPWAIRRFVRYHFLGEVTMLEGLQSTEALRRSEELVSGRWFHTAVAVGTFAGVVALANVVVGLLLLIALAGAPLWLFSLLVSGASAFVVPLSAMGHVLLYGDATAELTDVGRADPVPADAS